FDIFPINDFCPAKGDYIYRLPLKIWIIYLIFIYFFLLIIFTKVSLSDLFHRLMDPGCKPCLHDWIFFQKKCYLFYDEPAPWKTWEQSRRFCQDRRADLVVIDDLEEQFLEKRALKWGYWLGLQQTNNTWTWVDGHKSCTIPFKALLKTQCKTVKKQQLVQICLGYICFLCMKK
uniref:C-type lectin domain-containing protein n=1 Tax=Poecilia latipinna TaxID=48699 RepID=A0A3B3V4Z3_9TELE